MSLHAMVSRLVLLASLLWRVTAVEYAVPNQVTVSPQWLPGDKTFWYRYKSAHGGAEFVFVDTVAKTRQRAFDHDKVAQQLQQLTNQTIKAEFLPFNWIDLAPDASHLRFRAHDKAWSLSRYGTLAEWHGSPSGEVATRENLNKPRQGLQPGDSKTPKRQANSTEFPRVFVRGFNVWVAYSANDEHQITTNGTRENPFDEFRVYISPNKRFAVVWQYTPEQDHKIALVESSPKDQIQPKLRQIQYLKPGDRIRIDRPRLLNLEKRVEIATDDKLFKNPYSMSNAGWSNDGNEHRFLFNERGHQHLRIIGMNLNGQVRSLVEETSKTFIDYSSKMYRRVLNETEELIWASERDGWNHLYLYDLTKGVLKNQITKGDWLVRSVERVDTTSRRIWFRAFGIIPTQDPYYAHLARINFDGTDLKILTSGNGTHTWTFSPDQRQLTDTWSRIDQPPTSVLRDAETGEAILTLEQPSATNPLSSVAEIFVSPGRDGSTPIHGIIVKPSNFDPSKKYPILEDVYAGPQDFFAPKAYSTLNSYREWADRGYIVVKLDGMGTNWRSKAFHDVCYKNLKDAGFLDRIVWIKAAASTRSWMDLSRVGIKGGSAGGQNAVGALLFHGEFYKAAMADSGCHDNRMDKIWWNEQWMGWPVGKEYEESSNVVHAGKLEGKLLLIVGDQDDNVDPSSTFQVVNALNMADKDYEFLFIPGGGHGAGSGPYGRRRTADFFRRSLLDR
ncbi:peptidase S9B dipeptidylpeptidase IV domain protein [Lasiosphaeria hispida]|uniref:Probable dipeptidyl-aminopeptidase B n=1 Tax=Lasiosphaeria hispida TaxID=260671 RepID=A0AAJ0MD30_9PEZI|nr:peptidase S9B dipeptidylpeptidase IV domain protein [Lasiosphaeria hispida]